MSNFKVRKTIWKNKVEKLEINFPYYAWDSNKKESMVKLDVVYYENLPDKPIKWIKKVTLMKGFSLDSKIVVSHISTAGVNVISEDIIYVIRNFDIISDEDEFNKFMQLIINDVI